MPHAYLNLERTPPRLDHACYHCEQPNMCSDVSSFTCLNSPNANDVRPGAVHEARLTPSTLCEDAEERAGDDTAHGAICR